MYGKLGSFSWKNEIPCSGFLGLSLQGDVETISSLILGGRAGAREPRGAEFSCVSRRHGVPKTDKATW